MDLDLTLASKNKKTKILWLKDISDALVGQGFAVLRYHKRPYQLGQLIRKAKEENRKLTEKESQWIQRFQENPLQHFVEDCKSFAEYSHTRFPQAKIYILGGSEGTHVALWAAHELTWVSGVALIGFYARSLDTVTFEQVDVRDETVFGTLDKDHDGFLSKKERKGLNLFDADPLDRIATFDLDKDEQVSHEEFKGYLLTAWARKADIGHAYRIQEAKYPAMFETLKKAKYPVVFFQGMWDNQTPAYNAFAAQALAKHSWKKETLYFHYFPKLGHCLDPRNSPDDRFYQPIDPEALQTVATEMNRLFP
jgi:pimeloyl-ACP methyl ester carboxylesterase